MLFRWSSPHPKANITENIAEKKNDQDSEDDKSKLEEKKKEWYEEESDLEDEDDYYVEDELKNQKEFLETGDVHKRNLSKPGEIGAEDSGLVQIANIPLPKDLKVCVVAC